MNGTDNPVATENTQGQQAQPQQQPPQNWTPPAAIQPQVDPRRKSPLLAVLLSAMPGLGQVYVGYYQRGFIHILVVASLIAFLAGSSTHNPLIPMAALFMAFFWLYNLVDAGRRAMFYNHALRGEETIAPPEDFKMPSPGGSIVGGICLLGIGAILLSNTVLDYSLDWLDEWWPAALFIPGIWLIVKAIQEKSKSTSETGQDTQA